MKNNNISIRQAVLDDLPAIHQLFAGTIETICLFDYSSAQIAVWASSIENTQRWTDRLMKQYFIIAEINNEIVGFTSLENHAHIDLMYVHKDHQRQGIANTLYTALEAKAMQHGTTLLTSDVSITARPFFKRKGFEVIAEQKNDLKGIELINFKMSKVLVSEETTTS
jgi:putative acetyltransferase